MTERKRVPAIRFKGFTEDWEQRKLGDIARMHARIGWQNLRTSEFLDQGDYYLITGTDFDNGEIDFAHCHYVGKDRFDQDKNIQLQIGSILVTKDGTLGKIAYVKELDKPATLNAGVFNVLINDELDIDRVYLFQYLKAPFLMDFVEKGATGGTIKHLNQGLLVNFPINISSYGEQQRIGRFFSDLDTLITLHQRKVDSLKNVKQSMLTKMFPVEGETKPAIRFKGFTEDWEQRKVSNMFKVTRGYVLAATKTVANQTNDMPYPVYSSQTLSNGLLGFYNEYLYKDAITWTTDGANAGTVNYRIGKFYCTNVCGVLLSDKVKASQMIAESLNSVAKKYVSYVGNPKLMNNVMADIMINIPIALKEQEQISGLFTIVDTLITLHQREVDRWKNVKQSMLTKMFV